MDSQSNGPLNLTERFGRFTDNWRPKVIARLNGQEVKLVKIQGVFPWHRHENQDEMFLVWRGVFRVEFRDRVETLRTGEIIVIPAGVEHRTAADEEAQVICFEPEGVLNTGDAPESEFTAPMGMSV